MSFASHVFLALLSAMVLLFPLWAALGLAQVIMFIVKALTATTWLETFVPALGGLVIFLIAWVYFSII
jgi:hypothetical protein